jgi:pyruvate,water dikinase
MPTLPNILSLTTVNQEDYRLIGPKAAARAQLVNLNLLAPPAFVITSQAFYSFLSHSNGLSRFKTLIESALPLSPPDIAETARSLQKLVKQHEFDPSLAKEIQTAYHKIIKNQWAHLTISPNSTTKAPVNYPLPVIKGDTALLDFLRQLWASQLSPHALSLGLLSHHQRFEPAPIIVSTHEPAEISGFITTIDSLTANKNAIIIEAIWGTNPNHDPQPIPADQYVIDKTSHEIITRKIATQTKQITTDRFGHYQNTAVPSKNEYKAKLSDVHLNQLLQAAKKLQSHLMGPHRINWLITKQNKLFFTRFHQLDTNAPQTISHSASKTAPSIISKGVIVSPGIVTAPITRISSSQQSIIGHIVVLKTANPTDLKRLSKASGIIIQSGQLTASLAQTARDIGIPIIIGTGDIPLANSHILTLDAINGSLHITKANPKTHLSFPETNPIKKTHTTNPTETKTATKVLLSLSQIVSKDTTAYRYADGVGAFNASSLILDHQVHPKKLLENRAKNLNEVLTKSLSEVLQTFGDRPVIYHPIDLTTIQRKKTKYGRELEPDTDQNPLIGYRGAFRTINDSKLFTSEMNIIKTLRQKQQYKNLHLATPLIRSTHEFQAIKRLIAGENLYRSPSFKLYATLGTTYAISLIESLAKEGVDGFILDASLLHTLSQGYDPNTPELPQTNPFDNPTLLPFIAQACHAASKFQLPIYLLTPNSDSAQTISLIIKQGVNGIIIQSSEFETTKQFLHQAEVKSK